MSYMANAAKKDGTEIGAALPIAVNAPLLGKVKFNPAKFAWLGSVTPMTEVSTVWHTSPAKSLEQEKRSNRSSTARWPRPSPFLLNSARW